MVRDTCNCEKQALMMTSWTDLNPGRRVCRCPNYRESGGCRYWDWVDPELCQRSKDIIPGLIRTKKELESEIERLQETSRLQQAKLRRLKIYLFLHWVVVGLWNLLFKSGP